MLKRRGRRDLVHEALGPEDRRKLRLQHFQRDPPFVFQILGEVNGRHSALTELTLDAIPIGERGAKARGLERQRRMHVDQRPERGIALQLRMRDELSAATRYGSRKSAARRFVSSQWN